MIGKEEQELTDMFCFANGIHNRLFNLKMIISHDPVKYSKNNKTIITLVNDIQLHNLAILNSIESLRQLCSGYIDD